MKKLITILTVALCAVALTASAAKGKKGKGQTEEQKALLEKYDANKDGTIDSEEKAKASDEDKAKIEAAFPAKKKKKNS